MFRLDIELEEQFLHLSSSPSSPWVLKEEDQIAFYFMDARAGYRSYCICPVPHPGSNRQLDQMAAPSQQDEEVEGTCFSCPPWSYPGFSKEEDHIVSPFPARWRGERKLSVSCLVLLWLQQRRGLRCFIFSARGKGQTSYVQPVQSTGQQMTETGCP